VLTLYPHQESALKELSSLNKVAVRGYEGLYEVDELGNVYSIVHNAHRRKRQLKPFVNSQGYLKVNLYDADGKYKKKYIHRLVAEAFIPNPLNKPNVNHIDANVKNNNVNNLEWCTQSENLLHCVKLGRHRGYENRKRVVLS